MPIDPAPTRRNPSRIAKRGKQIRAGPLISDRLRRAIESTASQTQTHGRRPSAKSGPPWLPLSSDSPVYDQLGEIDEQYPAEPDDIDRIITAVRRGDHTFQPPAGRLAIIQAIDATSGDSILHMVARQGSYQGYGDILKEFAHPFEPWHNWAKHALVTHANHEGDTVLHIAARNGDRKLCTSIYRYFQNHSSALTPDQTDNDGGAPELRVYPDDFVPNGSDASLRFIIMTNKAGNTAEDEARAAGHEDVAQWLHDVTRRLDPDGKRVIKPGKAVLDRVVTEQYLYKEIIGEDYR